MYELIVIWDTGEKEIYPYETKEEAEEKAEGYKIAFGKQVVWTGVRERRTI